ncbi:hypothetical protein KM043_012066 [Ampulex compressa]|nr:hypothetical protein KM043_012066 [Ampulex compressa]
MEPAEDKEGMAMIPSAQEALGYEARKREQRAARKWQTSMCERGGKVSPRSDTSNRESEADGDELTRPCFFNGPLFCFRAEPPLVHPLLLPNANPYCAHAFSTRGSSRSGKGG